jgi:hypothetical protein
MCYSAPRQLTVTKTDRAIGNVEGVSIVRSCSRRLLLFIAIAVPGRRGFVLDWASVNVGGGCCLLLNGTAWTPSGGRLSFGRSCRNLGGSRSC